MRRYTVTIGLLACLLAILVAGGCRSAQPAGSGPESSAVTPSKAPSAPVSAAPAGDAANTVVVAVPCGITGPYGDIEKVMRRTNPELTLKPIIKNVTVLKRELLDGKTTCDVYMALGDVEAKQLDDAGKVAKSVPIVGSGLGLIVARGNPLGIKNIADLGSSKIRAISIASADTSGGLHAEEALKTAGVWDKVKGKAVRPDMPDLVKGYVMQGKADAAVIYRSCLNEVHRPGQEKQSKQGVSMKLEDAGIVDQKLFTPFSVMAVVMKDASNPAGADAFIKACLSPEGQKILGDWDFVPLADAEGGAAHWRCPDERR